MIYAVIDTNVIVSALFTSNIEAATVKVFNAILQGQIVPLYNKEIYEEYKEVLNRPKFHFPHSIIKQYLKAIQELGMEIERVHCSSEEFPDMDDIVFYEVAMSKDDVYLVTGNTKHFPKSPIVVTPAEMMQILMGKPI